MENIEDKPVKQGVGGVVGWVKKKRKKRVRVRVKVFHQEIINKK